MKVLFINYVCFALGIYVLLESLDPLRKMDGTMRCFCHKMKYLASLAVAAWVIYYAWHLQLDGYHLMMIGTIGLFIWPRTVWRFRLYFDDSEIFRGW